MNTDTPRTAFDPAAPADERLDAQTALQREFMPSPSDLIPRPEVARVIDYIRDQYAEQSLLQKAQVIPFPGRSRSKSGMQSVYLDRLQVLAYGDYFERPSIIGFESLRSMVEQTPVLNAVILTRIRQVQRFCNPQESDSGPGFQLAHIDPDHDLTKKDRAAMAEWVRFLTHCGDEPNAWARKRMHRDNFSTFVSKLVRESLTYDAAAIEVERQRGARRGPNLPPAMSGIYALDGSTIRLCTEEGYRGDDEIVAVQVVTGQIVTTYRTEDLIYEPRNPRADVRLAGYGMGETELLVRVVTGFLNAMTYNAKGFDDNSIPKGILHLVGEYSETDIQSFKRQWNAMVRGVNNAWALPVMSTRTPEGKATYEKIGNGLDEMHFSKWMTFLVSIICAVYGMSPSEINFDSFTAGSTSALSGSDTAEKLAASKDSGLRPLMAYLESVFSDYLISDFSSNFVFRWTGLDPRDDKERLDLRKTVLTVNEIRAQEGYAPMDGPLGDAPVNPSLIGPWMQLTQGGGDEADAEPGTPGKPDAGTDAKQPDGPNAPQKGTAQAPETAQTETPKSGGQDEDLLRELGLLKALPGVWEIES